MKAPFRPTPAPDDGAPSAPFGDRDRITAFLEGTVSSGASSQEVAEAVITAFGGIEYELMPIVGQRGVAALYKRAVHLARPSHPWLPPAAEGIAATMDLAALRTALAQQRAADAAAAGARLLQTFYGLLSSLIGPSLTERLLRAVWATFLGEPPARDNTTSS